MKIASLSILALLVAFPASAQKRMIPFDASGVAQKAAPMSGPIQAHGTSLLWASPEGKAALQDFHDRKARGLLPGPNAAKSSAAVGTQQIYKVFNFSTSTRDNIDFEMRASSDRFNIWVEVAELNNGHIVQADVDALVSAFESTTPAGSYDPNSGIIVNNEIVFGDPPDVDGDSKTDVLLVDVRDDYDPPNNNLFFGGFFDGADLSAVGNNKDIVYLDTFPGYVQADGTKRDIDNLERTLAHEYQHLIHANYDRFEITWVNEAQSEWAEVMLGYQGRPMTYLNDISEHDTEFFTFRDDGTAAELLDRERGQLFTLYLAEQLGVLTVGSITRDGLTEIGGYNRVIGVDEVKALILDFYTASILNDAGADARFGFVNPFYTGVKTMASSIVDGRTTSETPLTNDAAEMGAVVYRQWNEVTNFTHEYDVINVADIARDSFRNRVKGRAIVERPSGAYEFYDMTAGTGPLTIPGEAEKVITVIAHNTPDAQRVEFQFSASWGGSGAQTRIETVTYDDGMQSGDFLIFGGLLEQAQAVRFDVPDPDMAALDKVFVSPYFDSQFGNSEQPESAPRDLTLYVWEGPAGVPDATMEIFSVEKGDPRAYFPILLEQPELDYFEIDLSDNAAELSSLPNTIYIGVADAGTDENKMVVAPSNYTEEDVSFIGDLATNGWGELWAQADGDLEFTVIPIRAQFLITIPVAIEDEIGLPQTLILDQNYPNPFISKTNLQFVLPKPMEVELAVFDMLGRRVTTLMTGLAAAGTHDVELDASDWSAGLYLYQLSTPDGKVTRRMMLVK